MKVLRIVFALSMGILGGVLLAQTESDFSGWMKQVAKSNGALKGAVAIAEAPVGRGRVVVYGPEVVFRGQSHGTFRFLFNGILTARAESVSGVR